MTQVQQMTQWLTRLVRAVNENPRLVQRGKHVDALMLLDTGETQHLLDIRRGRIEALATGPFVMPSWDFALCAPVDEWLAFDRWRAIGPGGPMPFDPDVYKLLRRRVQRVPEGFEPLDVAHRA